MGATVINLRSAGNSMREAYNSAVEDAVYEHGNDPYNGTISTTRGFIDLTKEFKKSNLSIYEFSDKLYEESRLQKWGDAIGICLQEPIINKNKNKTKVHTNIQRGNRVWKTVYEVKSREGNLIGSSDFQTDAIKIAREYTEHTKERTYVYITKQLVGKSSLVSEVSYKPSINETRGTYYFIALAAE